MPSPKSGNPGSPVPPADPQKPVPADKADPGAMNEVKADQRETSSGKYGSTPLKPHKPPETDDEKKKKTSWIEIKLIDEEGHPVPGEEYRIALPDGETVARGTLDDKGFARVAGIDPGSCKVTFPNLDTSAWKRK